MGHRSRSGWAAIPWVTLWLHPRAPKNESHWVLEGGISSQQVHRPELASRWVDLGHSVQGTQQLCQEVGTLDVVLRSEKAEGNYSF